MNYREFAARIKQKHPGAYDDMEDRDLAQRMVAKYPQYSDVSFDDQPAKSSAMSPEQATQQGASLSPQSLLQNLAPSKVLPALGMARQTITENTGIDPTNLIDPVPNPMQLGKAIQQPVGTLKNIGRGLKRSAQAITDPTFQPTEQEAPVVRGGKIAGNILDVAMMPNSGPAKGGVTARASESLDSFARAKPGTTFELIKDPSKWFKIFQSKAGVKAAYDKAVAAGESVTDKVKNLSFTELSSEAAKGSKATIKTLTPEVAPMVEGTANIHTPTLTKFRKMLNDEIGRLDKQIQNGLRNESVQNAHVAMKARYQEMASRVNQVLDKVAPNFRGADALNSARKSMLPFRQGVVPFAVGTGVAALGTGLQQGFRALAGLGKAAKYLPIPTYTDAIQTLANARKKRKK